MACDMVTAEKLISSQLQSHDPNWPANQRSASVTWPKLTSQPVVSFSHMAQTDQPTSGQLQSHGPNWPANQQSASVTWPNWPANQQSASVTCTSWSVTWPKLISQQAVSFCHITQTDQPTSSQLLSHRPNWSANQQSASVTSPNLTSQPAVSFCHIAQTDQPTSSQLLSHRPNWPANQQSASVTSPKLISQQAVSFHHMVQTGQPTSFCHMAQLSSQSAVSFRHITQTDRPTSSQLQPHYQYFVQYSLLSTSTRKTLAISWQSHQSCFTQWLHHVSRMGLNNTHCTTVRVSGCWQQRYLVKEDSCRMEQGMVGNTGVGHELCQEVLSTQVMAVRQQAFLKKVQPCHSRHTSTEPQTAWNQN